MDIQCNFGQKDSMPRQARIDASGAFHHVMIRGIERILVGPNGVGKSTLFDLLFGIRHLIADNAKVAEVFPPEELTAWVNKTEQSFELDVLGEAGLFSYKLVISHNPDIKKQRIDLEQLLLDGKPLFEFKQGEVQLYHDDHKLGPKYPFDWSVSALATIGSRPDNKRLTWFKEWVESLFIVSLQPKAMTSVTDRSRKQRAASALIAMIDADNESVQDRIREFERECSSMHMPFRAQDEAVAIAVPRRNIETWIHYLNGNPVNEEDPYPKLDRERGCEDAVNSLLQMCRQTGLRSDAQPALAAACDEYNLRIRPLR